MHVLVAERDQKLAAAIARGLRRDGVAVDIAANGAMALGLSAATHYDVIVLDRDLPHEHREILCRRLRSLGCTAAILVLSAAGSGDSIAREVGVGADDLLERPFRLEEVLARVRALADAGAPHAERRASGTIPSRYGTLADTYRSTRRTQ